MPADLEGARVFVVEDEFLLGMALKEDLQAAGCVVLGPFQSLARAREAARREQFDFAILDINLAGEPVYPLADELIARGMPLMFLSGYGAADMPERFRGIRRLSKPHDVALLLREMRDAGGGGTPAQ